MIKILIMDDEPGIRTIVSNTLKPLGYPLFVAEDGRQALELARQEVPDLAMLDMSVPDMDGTEVLAELLKINPAARCIMLSGFADMDTAVSVIKQGAFDYISKPFKIDEVQKVVNRALSTMRQKGFPAPGEQSMAQETPTPAQEQPPAVSGQQPDISTPPLTPHPSATAGTQQKNIAVLMFFIGFAVGAAVGTGIFLLFLR